jgi:predicted RNA methylase
MFSNSQQLKPESIDYVGKILNLEKYNGRVNIAEPPSKNIVFKMAEKIELKNKPTSYENALAGNLEHNDLEKVFFSAQNIQIIQNAIKAAVYKMSENRYILPNQNINNLKIIMRGMYLQYADHNLIDSIRTQVERLNRVVLDYVIPSVYNEAVGYEKYCRDQSTLVVPLPLPLQHNREYKQLELKPWT